MYKNMALHYNLISDLSGGVYIYMFIYCIYIYMYTILWGKKKLLVHHSQNEKTLCTVGMLSMFWAQLKNLTFSLH